MRHIENKEYYKQRIDMYQEIAHSAIETAKQLRGIQKFIVGTCLAGSISCLIARIQVTGNHIMLEFLRVALALAGVFCLYIGTKQYFDLQKDVKKMLESYREALRHTLDYQSIMEGDRNEPNA